jgi:hypothetical protein
MLDRVERIGENNPLSLSQHSDSDMAIVVDTRLIPKANLKDRSIFLSERRSYFRMTTSKLQ